jgi:hypothetical protein
MWKAILGTLWGLRAIPLLFVAIVSTVWYFNGTYDTTFMCGLSSASILLTAVEGRKLYFKIRK